MQRTLLHRATDDDRLLLEENTAVFRLTPQRERGAAELGVRVGRRVRLELRDDGGHLLDSLTYSASLEWSSTGHLVDEPSRTLTEVPSQHVRR